KIRPDYAVAIEKYAICSLRGQYCVIANLSGAEAAIGVPDVLETAADFCLPAFDQPCSGRSGAIIGNNNLESGVPLPRKRSQDCIERILAIIGRDDDRNHFGHISYPLTQPFEPCFARSCQFSCTLYTKWR